MTTEANRPPAASSFGAKMKNLRIAAGLTQEELAERTGLSVRGISDLERGARSRPHFETVRMLAEALELSASERAELVAAARPESTGATHGMPHIEVVRSLPIPATRLIGREQEVEEGVGLLDHGQTRLLTLTGPGGVGKTRLAIEVASRSADAENAIFVDLAPITEPELVATSIVRALGLRDAGDRSPIQLLTEALRDAQMLLVLDNYEQVVAARSVVADLIMACPKLKILVTSRTPLHLQGEQEYPVPPLATPDPNEQVPIADVEKQPAVTLFIQRARVADPHFSFDQQTAVDVVEVCYRLDGLPLAIELAAARVKLLPPQVLAGRSGHRLPLLASGPQDAPARHQTMRATIAWSYDLLSPEAQTLFRRMAVFAGGCTLDAIDAVCANGLPIALDQLSELIDQGLVHRFTNHDVSPRYRMQEVVREYARERLEESDESIEIHRAHARYYLDLAMLAKGNFSGPEEAAWMARLAAEQADLDATVEFAIAQNDAETAFQLGGSLWAFWAHRGQLWEGKMWLERALALGDETPSPGRFFALHALGNLAIELADLPRARSLFEAIRELGDALNDEDAIIVSRNGLGLVAWYQGSYDESESLHETNLVAHRIRGERVREAIDLKCLGDIALATGRLDEARERHQEALAIQQEIGHADGVAYCLLSLGETVRYGNDPETAQAMFERSLQVFGEVGDSLGESYALCSLGRVASVRKDYSRANELFLDALVLWREFGDRRGIVECVEGLAGVALASDKRDEATRLFGSAAAARVLLGMPLPPVARPALDAALQSLRDAMGDAAFERAWSLGQLMTIEQAATEAAAAVA